MWSVLQSMEDMGRDMENAVDIYLRFATEASEKLVRLEAALLVGDNSGHAVHQTRFGLLVESQRIVRQHTGKQSWKAEQSGRLIFIPLCKFLSLSFSTSNHRFSFDLSSNYFNSFFFFFSFFFFSFFLFRCFLFDFFFYAWIRIFMIIMIRNIGLVCDWVKSSRNIWFYLIKKRETVHVSNRVTVMVMKMKWTYFEELNGSNPQLNGGT